jgi:hypothetical protein
MLVFFPTLKASCIRNLFHQDRWWMVNSIVTFRDDGGETSSANVQTSRATTPGPCIMTMIQLPWTQKSSSTLPTHWTSPPVIFSSSQRWNWSLRTSVLTALKIARLNHRMWRCWSEMTSNSASDHGNPTGITVSMQKGTTSKGMEANRNFDKWLSCSRRISETFR